MAKVLPVWTEAGPRNPGELLEYIFLTVLKAIDKEPDIAFLALLFVQPTASPLSPELVI